MKRPAAAGLSGAPAKKRPSTNPAMRKCVKVADAISAIDPEVLPVSARELLTMLVEGSLSTPKDERHAFQGKVVDMLGQALHKADAHLEKAVQDAKAKSDGVKDERLTRQQALTKANQDLAALEAVVVQKKESRAAAQEALG